MDHDKQRMAGVAAPKTPDKAWPTARECGIGFRSTMEMFTMRWSFTSLLFRTPMCMIEIV